MSAFIYIEPFEVRKEIIVRPEDMQRWLDLGLSDSDIIPVEKQGEIKLKIAAFLSDYHPVSIDGKVVHGQLQRVNFLKLSLTSSRVIDPPEPLRVDSAIMGIIYVYPVATLPEKVVMDWNLWDGRVQVVPAAAVDEAGPLQVFLGREWPQLTWNNFLTNPTLPTLSVVSKPPPTWLNLAYGWRWIALVLSNLLILASIVAYLRHRRWFSPIAGVILVAMGITMTGFYAEQSMYANQKRVREVVAGLLHNIYRAFDFRDESDIYDVLDQSVKGDLLAEIYLETQRSLELANQGGARAKVKTVELKSLDELRANQQGLQLRASWVVAGSVGHWGHVHQRINQYQADLKIEPIAGAWKLTQMTVLEEERL